VDEDCRAVDDGVFVVSGGEASPLCHVAESAFDDIAVLVIVTVQAHWPTAS
jgi:hypothetical protein